MRKPWGVDDNNGENKVTSDTPSKEWTEADWEKATGNNEDEVKAKEKKEADAKKIVPVCWTTGVKRVDKCSMFEDKKFVAIIACEVNDRIKALTRAVGRKEWLGYLKGEYLNEDDNRVFLIRDMDVPLQEVTAGSVDVLQPQASEEIMGTVHLHPFGGNLWFSSTDDKYIAGNHRLTIVTNPNGEYKAQMKHTLPCGGSFLSEGEVIITTPKDDEVDAFVTDALDRILDPPPRTPMVVANVNQTSKQESVERHTSDASEEALSSLPNLYCAGCRSKTEPNDRRWLLGIMLCEECYYEEIGFNDQPTNVP